MTSRAPFASAPQISSAGEVEPERDDMEDVSSPGSATAPSCAAQEVDEVAVGDLDPLRGPGRARGEEDVGEAVTALPAARGHAAPRMRSPTRRSVGAASVVRAPASSSSAAGARWVGGVEGDVGASRPQDAEKAPTACQERGRQTPTGSSASIPASIRPAAIAPLAVELGVGDGPLAVFDRDCVGLGSDLLGDQRGHGQAPSNLPVWIEPQTPLHAP